jgi:hypothetical protein
MPTVPGTADPRWAERKLVTRSSLPPRTICCVQSPVTRARPSVGRPARAGLQQSSTRLAPDKRSPQGLIDRWSGIEGRFPPVCCRGSLTDAEIPIRPRPKFNSLLAPVTSVMSSKPAPPRMSAPRRLVRSFDMVMSSSLNRPCEVLGAIRAIVTPKRGHVLQRYRTLCA